MRSGDASFRAISFAPLQFPDTAASQIQMDVDGMPDLCTITLARQGQPSRSTNINHMPPPSPPIQLPTALVGQPLFQISRAPSDEPIPTPVPRAVTAPATCGIRRELDLLDDESHEGHVKRIRLDQAEKQTARNYSLHIESFIKWWEVRSDAEQRAAQPERWLNPVPALPITAVKASFFFEHESTRRVKVRVCSFV